MVNYLVDQNELTTVGRLGEADHAVDDDDHDENVEIVHFPQLLYCS